ncbi:hypothetical protein GCM10011575_02110 [Microlunatus endophyticus]|uniref:DUF2510 domain-containing protein n=1 Tax=Microlunatus endophyticus TaxID=1716077 RepID=A0A917RZX7_9ACTN|nr:DUF2510 domain-containing protein [Microlunatus endophyticus]GGL47790.1 hypothetical protein GCM10011575_02110 [Microlunatus endophyticus]
MPSAGWYPDPDQTPGRYRYWDGSAWTDRTRLIGPRRRRRGPVVAVLVLAVVAVVITALVIRSHRAAVADSDPPPSTSSAWDDSSPLPTTSPTPSVQPVPTGHPEACEQYDASQPPAEPEDGRVHGGPLSFAELGGNWGKPVALNRFPFSKDSYVQSQDMHEELGWQASAEVGVNTMRPFPGADQATARLLQCLVTSDFYASVHVKVTENSSRPIMIGDTKAVQRDALLRFHHPQLKTTGSRIRIIVVESDPVTYYFDAVPMERTDLIKQLDRATSSLRVDN